MLEPGRTLTLAEKGGAGAEEVTAAPGFRLVATMNPGGDYGKRELSPALANRFTAVWVPPIEDPAELAALLNARLAGKAPPSTIHDHPAARYDQNVCIVLVHCHCLCPYPASLCPEA